MKHTTKMQVLVVSPESEMYSGEADMVFVKGANGDLGIAPGHLQLLTSRVKDDRSWVQMLATNNP